MFYFYSRKTLEAHYLQVQTIEIEHHSIKFLNTCFNLQI